MTAKKFDMTAACRLSWTWRMEWRRRVSLKRLVWHENVPIEERHFSVNTLIEWNRHHHHNHRSSSSSRRQSGIPYQNGAQLIRKRLEWMYKTHNSVSDWYSFYQGKKKKQWPWPKKRFEFRPSTARTLMKNGGEIFLEKLPAGSRLIFDRACRMPAAGQESRSSGGPAAAPPQSWWPRSCRIAELDDTVQRHVHTCPSRFTVKTHKQIINQNGFFQVIFSLKIKYKNSYWLMKPIKPVIGTVRLSLSVIQR